MPPAAQPASESTNAGSAGQILGEFFIAHFLSKNRCSSIEIEYCPSNQADRLTEAYSSIATPQFDVLV